MNANRMKEYRVQADTNNGACDDENELKKKRREKKHNWDAWSHKEEGRSLSPSSLVGLSLRLTIINHMLTTLVEIR